MFRDQRPQDRERGFGGIERALRQRLNKPGGRLPRNLLEYLFGLLLRKQRSSAEEACGILESRIERPQGLSNHMPPIMG
jgi:hypothetical protein